MHAKYEVPISYDSKFLAKVMGFFSGHKTKMCSWNTDAPAAAKSKIVFF